MNQLSPEIYSAMQTEKPYKSYKKAILGQVYVNILDPWNGTPDAVILKGDPKKTDEGTVIDVWSVKEDEFFKRMNRFHIKNGNIVEYVRPETQVVSESEKYNNLSDEELKALLANKNFMQLKAALIKMTSVAPILRLMHIAENEGTSVKFMEKIKARLAELELEEQNNDSD